MRYEREDAFHWQIHSGGGQVGLMRLRGDITREQGCKIEIVNRHVVATSYVGSIRLMSESLEGLGSELRKILPPLSPVGIKIVNWRAPTKLPIVE